MKKYKINFTIETAGDFKWERFGVNIKALAISFLDTANKEYGEYPVSFDIEEIK